MRAKRAKQLRREATLVFFAKVKQGIIQKVMGKAQTFKNFYRRAKRFYNQNKKAYA